MANQDKLLVCREPLHSTNDSIDVLLPIRWAGFFSLTERGHQGRKAFLVQFISNQRPRQRAHQWTVDEHKVHEV